jgi:hypothetical protein
MKQISYAKLEAHFDPERRDRLKFLADTPGATALVLFKNQTLDSSSAGACTARLVGPMCLYTSLEQAYASHLGDLPSQRQQVVAHCLLPVAAAPSDDQLLNYFKACRQDDDLELDELVSGGSNVSRGDDPGAWVRAWVWCPDADVQAWLETEQGRAAAAAAS